MMKRKRTCNYNKANNIKYVLYFLLLTLITSCDLKKDSKALELYNQTGKDDGLNVLTTEEQKNGWNLLFDGKSFNGWHGYNLLNVPEYWIVEDNAVTMTTEGRKEGSDVITDKKYKSFALTLEFKLTKGANSGVIFQVEENSKYGFPYETGPEFQVIDHENWPGKLEDWQICGANYAMYPPKIKEFKKIGEWNKILLLVDSNKVTQVLNGNIVVEYEKYSKEWEDLRKSGKWANYPDYGKFDEGFISLQNHGAKVWYRNIKIKEL